MLLSKKELNIESVDIVLASLDQWKDHIDACSTTYKESFQAIYDQMKEGLGEIRGLLIDGETNLPVQIYLGSIGKDIHGMGIVFSDEGEDNLRFLVSSPASQIEKLHAGSQLLNLIVQDISQPGRAFTLEATTASAEFYKRCGFIRRADEDSWDNTMYYPTPTPTLFAKLSGATGEGHASYVAPKTDSAPLVEVRAA